MPSDFDDQRFLQKKDRVAGGDSQPHFIVFTNGKVPIEKADLLENASVKQHRTGTDDAKRQAAMINPAVVLTVYFPGIDSPAFSNPGLVRIDHPIVGMAPEDFKLSFQLGGFPMIVAVQKADPREARELNSGVSGPAYAQVALVEVVNTRVREPLEGSPALIIGAVIDHQEFPFLEGLVDDRLEGPFQKLASIEGG